MDGVLSSEERRAREGAREAHRGRLVRQAEAAKKSGGGFYVTAKDMRFTPSYVPAKFSNTLPTDEERRARRNEAGVSRLRSQDREQRRLRMIREAEDQDALARERAAARGGADDGADCEPGFCPPADAGTDAGPPEGDGSLEDDRLAEGDVLPEDGGPRMSVEDCITYIASLAQQPSAAAQAGGGRVSAWAPAGLAAFVFAMSLYSSA